jgi:hypothetical protein
MLKSRGDHVGRRVIIVVREAVEGLPVDIRDLRDRLGVCFARRRECRHAVIGDAVLLLMQQAQRESRVRAEAEADRGCDTPAVGLDEIAADDFLAMDHEVDAESARLAELQVHIADEAAKRAVADRARARDVAVEHRHFRLGVDAAASRAATEQKSGRTFQHLDGFVVEAVACVDAEVTKPVDIDVVLGVEAADTELVAVERAAPFADRERDPGDIPQRLIERGDGLLLQDLAGDHIDGLRRVLDRPGEPGDAALPLERHLVLVLDPEGAKFQGLVLRVRALGRRGHGCHGGGGQHGGKDPGGGCLECPPQGVIEGGRHEFSSNEMP